MVHWLGHGHPCVVAESLNLNQSLRSLPDYLIDIPISRSLRNSCRRQRDLKRRWWKSWFGQAGWAQTNDDQCSCWRAQRSDDSGGGPTGGCRHPAARSGRRAGRSSGAKSTFPGYRADRAARGPAAFCRGHRGCNLRRSGRRAARILSVRPGWSQFRDRRAPSRLSSGMKQKLSLALAPTNDAASRCST